MNHPRLCGRPGVDEPPRRGSSSEMTSRRATDVVRAMTSVATITGTGHNGRLALVSGLNVSNPTRHFLSQDEDGNVPTGAIPMKNQEVP
jgi:hypothetical protein